MKPKLQSTERPSAAAPHDDLRRALLAYYDRHQRRLPWRGESDPYCILVSEVMLQQTRVETVLDYYGGWLERFPDFESLADAELDDVLKAWEGLGYYRRARNLHRAAQAVRERPDGSLPSSYSELRQLPGVGDYTAGAVASIAFGEVVPAPDGNVRRVLARLYDVRDAKTAWLRRAAAELVDPMRPGDWNQALMELGATVCRPRAPACDGCPVARWCRARAAGTQEERPLSAARPRPRTVIFAVAVVHRGGQVLLERRPADGLLGGMWAFPEMEVEEPGAAEAAACVVAGRLGWRRVGGSEPLPPRRHEFTHLRATYLPYLLEAAGDGSPRVEGHEELAWLDPSASAAFALPVAQRRILESAHGRLAGGVA